MKFTKRVHNFALASAVCVALLACVSRPELLPKSAAVPVGVDLSGIWLLREDPNGRPLPTARGNERIVIPPANSRRRVETRFSKRSKGSAVEVFIESGSLLKISQTSDGLFISFDRAIVEEYTFGENRVVSVGPIEAQRVSGWQGSIFVVETLDAQGSLLTESWIIDVDTDMLVREISVSKGDKERFSSQQRFDRS